MRVRRSWRIGWSSAVVLVTASVLLTAGCAPFEPYRTATLARAVGPPDAVIRTVECNVDVAPLPIDVAPPPKDVCERARTKETRESPIGHHAIQHRHYAYRAENGAPRRGDYHLAFVEFDDQGWFADRKQMEALFMLLSDFKIKGQYPLIYVYAHGWKHDASPCDGNVICFSRFLERMDVLKRELEHEPLRSEECLRVKKEEEPVPKKDRPMVGVYVGWRGLSLKVAKNATFWTRKATAERVGRGGVKELLTRLNNYRQLTNPYRCNDRTHLIVTGHSFGGLVIYQALTHILMDRASEVRHSPVLDCRQVTGRREEREGEAREGDLLCYDVAKSFGDFVLLVNPALEGSLYEPLFHVATNRCYPKSQRPIMMTVTSSGDAATGTAFPLGRWLSSFFEHHKHADQRDSILRTVGHQSRYQTHELEWDGPNAPEIPGEAASPEECTCRLLPATKHFRWWEVTQELRRWRHSGTEKIEADVTDGKRLYKAYGKDVVLAGDQKYVANYPYLVVKASSSIIPDHNSIYTEPFIQFLHSFFVLHVAYQLPFEGEGCFKPPAVCVPGGMIPCEQSCQLADGRSCSGRRTDDVPDAAPTVR